MSVCFGIFCITFCRICFSVLFVLFCFLFFVSVLFFFVCFVAFFPHKKKMGRLCHGKAAVTKSSYLVCKINSER